jgi:hypothetical protein
MMRAMPTPWINPHVPVGEVTMTANTADLLAILIVKQTSVDWSSPLTPDR